MSWQATAWVIDKSKHKGSALLTLLCIANCANETGTDAFPGLPRLAKDTRMSLRQVGRIVEKLETSGELTVRRVEGRVHHYSLPLMTPVKMSGVQKIATPDKSALTPDILAQTPDIAMSPDPSVRTLSKNDHKNQAKPLPPKPDPPFSGEKFLEALATYEAHLKHARRSLTNETRLMQYLDMQEWGEDKSTRALRLAVKRGWKGVFDPDEIPIGRNGNNGANGKTKHGGQSSAGDSTQVRSEIDDSIWDRASYG